MPNVTAAASTRNPLKLAGVPLTTGPISAAAEVHHIMGTSGGDIAAEQFFSNCRYVPCEDIAQQSGAMAPRWRFLAIFCVLYFQRAACSRFQTCILNSH